MPSIAQEASVDFFLLEPSAGDYMAAAFRALDRGESVIHDHDAFEIRVGHQILEDDGKVFCFMAINRAREARRLQAYLPYEPLPEGWIDEL